MRAHKCTSREAETLVVSRSDFEPSSILSYGSATQHEGWEPKLSSSSVDSIMETVGFGRYQYILLLCCGIGYMADTAGLLYLGFVLPFLEESFQSTRVYMSLSNVASSIGLLVGSIFWGVLSDIKGRKVSFVGSALFSSVFGLLCALATSANVFIILRLLFGFGLGGHLTVDFAFFIESIPSSSRGRWTIGLTFFGIFGVIYVSICAWMFLALSWRTYTVMCALPGFAVLLPRVLLSETPYHKYARGDAQGAMESMMYMAKFNGIEIKPVELTAPTVSSSSCSTAKWSNSMTELFQLVSFEQLIMLWMVWFLVAFSFGGFNLWMPDFLGAHHIHNQGAYRQFFLMSLIEIPGLLVSWLTIDRYGRIGTLKYYLLGVGLAMFAFAASPNTFDAVACCDLVGFFLPGCWSVIYIYTMEFFPTTLRTSGAGTCRIFSSVAGMLTGPMSAYFIELHPMLPLYVYSVMLLVSAGVVACFLIEPSSKDLLHTTHDQRCDERRG